MTTLDDQDGISTVPWQSATLMVILLSTLVGVMGVSLISPILPDLRHVFGVPDAQVGLIITAYTLPGVVLTPFVGLAADRFGRRRVLVPLLFTFGVAGAAIAVVSSFNVVLALRFLQGVGASALVTLAVTLIGDLYAGEGRDRVMGTNASMIGIGVALYPVIGGTLGAVHWTHPFLFFGVAVVVGVVATVFLDEPADGESMSVRSYLGRMRAVAVLPAALALFSAVFLAFFVYYGAIFTALPFLMSDEFGLGSGRIGLVIAMVSVANSVVSLTYGYVSSWFEPPQLVSLGFVLFGSSLLGVWLAPSPLFVGVALLLFGSGFGVAMPALDTTAVTVVNDQLRAGMMSLRTSMLRLGQTLGPVAFTFTAGGAFEHRATGYSTLMLVTGTTIILGGCLTFLVFRR